MIHFRQPLPKIIGRTLGFTKPGQETLMKPETQQDRLLCNPLLHGRIITVGSLFSGIGGFELGLRMASPRFRIEWQVEIDEYCRNILERHFPGVSRWDDVRTFKPTPVDVLVGGFP